MSDFRDKYWYTDIREIETITELLEGSVEKFPNNPAFWIKKEKGGKYESIDYTLLKHDVYSLGTKLKSMGILSRKIAVMGVGCYNWIVTYLAVVIGGGVIVPIDKDLKPQEIQNILNTSECTTIFYSSDLHEKIQEVPNIENRVVMQLYGDRTDIKISLESCIKEEQAKSDETFVTKEGNIFSWKELVSQGEILLKKGDVSYSDVTIDPDEMSVLLFTSGTTGNPKGVMLSQRNITANIMDTCRIAHIMPNDKTLSILPIHHTYECTFGQLLILYRGASTAFCEGLKYITTNMNECQNSVLIAVPLVIEMIYNKIWKQVKKQGKEKTLKNMIQRNNRAKAVGINLARVLFRQIHKQLGGHLHIVITGAAALAPNVLRGYEDLGITVLQGYGLTECTPLVSGTPQLARERYKKAGSVGLVVKSGEIRVVNTDENGIGEILYRGPNVMLGYYKMEEETNETIQDGWFNTGDLGFVDKEGWLYLTGRHKNVIVTKTGKNIYPEEIEEVVNRNSCVADCMVYESKHTDGDVVGIQILPDMEELAEILGENPSNDEIYKYMKNMVNDMNMSLTSYKRVKDVFVRDEDFVRTTTKKIRRQDNI